MSDNDHAILAQVDQDLAKFSAAVHHYAGELAVAITVLGYPAAVMNCWSRLKAQPAETRDWIAAVACAELARQHPGGGPPAARSVDEAPDSWISDLRRRPGAARVPFRLSRLLSSLLARKTATASAMPPADRQSRQSGSE